MKVKLTVVRTISDSSAGVLGGEKLQKFRSQPSFGSHDLQSHQVQLYFVPRVHTVLFGHYECKLCYHVGFLFGEGDQHAEEDNPTGGR